MDADDEIVKVTEIYGASFIKKSNLANKHLCHLNLGAKFFSRMIYRQPNHHDVFVEQAVYNGRREILNRCLPAHSRNSRLAFRDEIVQHRPEELENPGTVILEGPNRAFRANDINWNIVSDTLSRYADYSGAYPEHGRREVFGVRGDVAFGEVRVMRPEGGWEESYYRDPEGNVNDTECPFCYDPYDFQDPDHINQVVEIPCRHVFHKTCIYKWIWLNQVYNCNETNNFCYCPNCDSFIC